MNQITTPFIQFQACALQLSRCTAILLLSFIFLASCGGSGSAEQQVNETVPPPVQEQGEIQIAITDAEGDFISYTVDVVSLVLEKANGDVVETLPLTTRIDFAELTEVTEFLSIATVPAGNYESVVMTLDYQQAEIVVQDTDGNAVIASAVDANGDTLGVFDVRLNLSDSDIIRIAPGIPASFSLDFDLDASNTIDLSAVEPLVTVEPFLLATAELETDREHRVRGVLRAVNLADSQFALNVRPFRHRSGNFGTFEVNVNDTTQYEVDGVGYTGNDGLLALDNLDIAAPVITNGNISGRSIMADIVIAGSSVPWTDGTVIKGVVSARSGMALTVRGVRVEYENGVERFRGIGTVQLGAGTTVTAPGVDNEDLSIDSISVGQRIVAFGELVDDQTVDASTGRVVMLMNQLTGEVLEANPLAVNLYFLNGRNTRVYNFTGTGLEAALDADPDNYEIYTGDLSLDTLATGDLVRVRGLVSAFGEAPEDYLARTVIDVNTESRPGSLRVFWPDGSTMPFHSLSDQMIDIDISESREVLRLRGVPRAYTNPAQSAVLVPTDSGRGVYAVKVRGSAELHLFRTFEELVVELNEQLDSGATLHQITAHVQYSNAATEFVTARASFVFKAVSD